MMKIAPARLAALLVLVLVIVGALAFVLPKMFSTEEELSTGNTDFPVVIRTKGGMLEVATVKYRKSIQLTKIPTIGGARVPFCHETAHADVNAAITYRIPLAEEWTAKVSKGALYVSVPAPQPSLPVAIDTRTLRQSLDKCWLMFGLDTQQDLVRSTSAVLEKDARSASARQLAMERGGRRTVEEFVRNWMFKQTDYAQLAPDAPIHLNIEKN